MSDHSAHAGAGREPDPDRIVTQQDFGRELTLLRHRRDLTVRQVARASGLPVSTAGDYFSGRHLPAAGQAATLRKILRACGETDQARLAQWANALGRARRQPGKRAPGGDVPYRGLAGFELEDAPWYFGREDVVQRLAVMATRWGTGARVGLPLIVVGPSGSGKSSLLRAGLMPRLTGPVTLFVPTASPAEDFAKVTAGLPAVPEPRYVIIDQFEAVFTRCQDEDTRQEFIGAVCELTQAATVILALRADFYDQALRYPGLAAALQARQVVLGPMTADQVRRAIVEPARRAHLDVEDGLVELLLRDLDPRTPTSRAQHQTAQHETAQHETAQHETAQHETAQHETAQHEGAHEPGALPLLSHALLRTWELSSGSTITVADYLASGGISDAITRTAEGVYGRLPAEAQDMARRLFLRLVSATDDAPPARSVVQLAELGGLGGPDLLGRFVDRRLITVDADTAQIAHDTLLVAWPRLRSWIDAGRDDLRTRRRITEAARIWEETGRDSSALPRGLQLAIARDWAAEPGNRAALGTLGSEFVAVAVIEEKARMRAERRRTRRLRLLITALTLLVITVFGLAGYSFEQRMTAADARNAADSRQVAVEAGQVRGENVPLAAQLSLAAYGIARTPEATASLLESSGAPSAARLTDSRDVVESVSLNPGRGLLAAAAADGTLRLWDVANPGHPAPVGGPLMNDRSSPLYTTAISPGGEFLAAAGADRTISLWNITDPSRPMPLGKPLSGPASTVYSVAFSPSGKLLAAGSADDTVRIWNLASPLAPALLATLHGPAGYVESVAFSPSGRQLAAGSADKTVRLWSVANPSRPVTLGAPLGGPASTVMSVAFSPSGQQLAAGSQDGKVWLWNVAQPERAQPERAQPERAQPEGALKGPAGGVYSVSFSPSGRELAAGSSDDSAYVWDLGTRALTADLPHPQLVSSLAWDGPDRLASADADGTVSMWSLPCPVLMAGAPVYSVAFSPSGTMMAVGSQTLQLWDPVHRVPLATVPVPRGTFVNSVAFGPSGLVLAAGYGNGTFQLWSRDGKPLGPPLRASASGLAESVAFSPDGRLLATGGDDGTMRVWSLGASVRRLSASVRRLGTVRDSGSPVYSVAFSPDGRTLAAASGDGMTRLWSVADPASPRLLGGPLGGPASYATSVTFSPSGNLLAVGSADKTARLWSVADPSRPRVLGMPLSGPASYVYSVAFSPSGRELAAGAADGTVWLWNLAIPAQPSVVATITGPNGHVYSVAFSPSGRRVGAGSADGTVRLWDTSPAAAAAAVCANAGQPLTRLEWDNYVPGLAYRAPCS